MSSVALQSLHQTLQPSTLETHPFKSSRNDIVRPFSVNINSKKRIRIGGNTFSFKPKSRSFSLVTCSSKSTNSHANALQNNNQLLFDHTFQLQTIRKVDGRLHVRLDQKDKDNWELIIGCSLPGKWILHWGVHYVGVVGSEWDQPPQEMRPPGSIIIKDYAVETPMKKSYVLESGEYMHEVKIDFNSNCNIAAINFVLKDEETGSWYQHRGRDFMVPLVDYLRDRDNVIGEKKGLNFWAGKFGQLEAGGLERTSEEKIEAPTGYMPEYTLLEKFDEAQPLIKEIPVYSSLNVSVKKCPETSNNLVYLETDLPGIVVVHWGVCSGRNKKWEVPEALHPLNTDVYKNKALRTILQKKHHECSSEALFTFGEEIPGFAFVLKVNDKTWLNHGGDDFFIPLSQALIEEMKSDTKVPSRSVDTDEKSSKENQDVHYTTFTEGIIRDIKDLVTDLSSGTNWKTGSKESQESVLREIEKLAAEAYSIFRTSTQDFSEEAEKESQVVQSPATIINSGTGSGYEILCQGFNWESHKSGKWYMEIHEKADELSSLGFTVIWLPPPTDSVSPEGYMPKDLYNLNSRYGTVDELKLVVEKLHEVGIKVLGDVVLNHRCAEYQNSSGVWNIFGGPLNWDDRAVVGDDPHFAGKGNKSSGDNFHAAPNIDHSQDFVRRDIKEWLRWLRKDIGYDGWRLDFVRGFWGGYVNDYIDSSKPYFAVGEFWDSLTYTYGEMDYDQDPHRQRIIDWINAAGGTSGAFDVTTKGILHSVLERCEYWRLSDPKGKPPGVVGWWPSRAVTFIENHDTGSTQGHWRFPSGREMQGYAYILTHPGTPSVFYDHIFSHYQSEISALISLRTRKQLHCRSSVKIAKAKRDVYAAVIDEKVAMKIGPGHYDPPSGPQKWSLAIEGKDYKVWEAL